MSTKEPLRLLGIGTTPTADLVGATLLSALAAADDSFALVLDDFHVVTALPMHDLVRFSSSTGPSSSA